MAPNPRMRRHQRRAWGSTEQLIAHTRERCVARELTDAERQQFGLPER